MENSSVAQQLKRNSVALLSLMVALSALFYNTWRTNGDQLSTSLDAASNLSEEVLSTRRTVLESLRSLK